MHNDTVRELIDACASMAGSVIKDTVVRQKELDSKERQKELEVELAKVRNEHGNPHATSTEAAPPEPPETQAIASTHAVGAGADLSAAIEVLKAREDCQTCLELLEAIEAAPPAQQATALAEYGEFAQASLAGAPEAELRSILEESPTLVDLLENRVTA